MKSHWLKLNVELVVADEFIERYNAAYQTEFKSTTDFLSPEDEDKDESKWRLPQGVAPLVVETYEARVNNKAKINGFKRRSVLLCFVERGRLVGLVYTLNGEKIRFNALRWEPLDETLFDI